MQKAIDEAKKAYSQNEVPVGCVIVQNNICIGTGYNLKESTRDATAHAEIIAIKNAQKTLSDWRLTNCNMYVTLEPCLMCAGAILHSRINHVYFGTWDHKWGGESLCHLFTKKLVNHTTTITYQKNNACADLLKSFFKGKRNNK